MTDHKPLTTLLSPSRGIPPLVAARLQRWAWLLSAYSYDIEFRRTNEHSNTDGLSRLPLPVQPPSSTEATFVIGQIQALPVTVDCLVKATRKDPILSRVMQYVGLLKLLKNTNLFTTNNKNCQLKDIVSYGGAEW